VSLILEALKKLEREKKSPERGFLVTTRAAWPSAGARPVASMLAALALLGTGALGAWLVLDGSGRGPDASRRPVQAPAAPPSTTLRARLAEPAALPSTLLPPPASRPATAPVVPPASTWPSAAPRPRVASRPLATAVASPEPAGPPELRLEAVSQRDGQPIAVVSGHLVHEGDTFDNVHIVRIGAAEVEIEVDGQRLVLSF